MNDDRRNAIIRLLDTRHENLPEPVRRSEASTGFAHTEPTHVSCPDCLANDKVMFGCETCGGRGYTEVKRERDPYSLSDKIVAFGFDGSRHDASRARDRQIDSLEQQLLPARSEAELLEEANRSPYAWERARAQMYRRYDYGELDRAIEWLWQLFPGVKLRGGCRGNGPSGCFTLGFLDVVLPDPLRAPGAESPTAQLAQGRVARAAGPVALQKRDEEIRRAVLRARIPTGDVARTWGISVSQVNRIVADAA